MTGFDSLITLSDPNLQLTATKTENQSMPSTQRVFLIAAFALLVAATPAILSAQDQPAGATKAVKSREQEAAELIAVLQSDAPLRQSGGVQASGRHRLEGRRPRACGAIDR
jgi:hypothetical protein